MNQRLIRLAWVLAWLPAAALAQPPAGSCEAAHQQCLVSRQAVCDRPQSTSDEREHCLESCASSLTSCKAAKAVQDSARETALAEIQRTGGPKPAQCPKGWMVEQRGTNAATYGSFKCFLMGTEKAPADFKCPPGLKLTKGTDALFCDIPRP